jgi:dynein heavy chain, axonemal
MPEQYRAFKGVDKLYREEVKHSKTDATTYKLFAKRETVRQSLDYMLKQFEYLMKCLIKYLELKRNYFPRLYFLSNEQIIEIVGMLEDINLLEKSMFKMFEGVDKLLIVYDEIDVDVSNISKSGMTNSLTASATNSESGENSSHVWRN